MNYRKELTTWRVPSPGLRASPRTSAVISLSTRHAREKPMIGSQGHPPLTVLRGILILSNPPQDFPSCNADDLMNWVNQVATADL